MTRSLVGDITHVAFEVSKVGTKLLRKAVLPILRTEKSGASVQLPDGRAVLMPLEINLMDELRVIQALTSKLAGIKHMPLSLCSNAAGTKSLKIFVREARVTAIAATML